MESTAETKALVDSLTNQIYNLLNTTDPSKHTLVLTGKTLSISDLHAFINGKFTHVVIGKEAQTAVYDSHECLMSHIKRGISIYGVNTGFGGSADVRCEKDAAVQRGLILHQNAGFGSTLPSWLVKAAMMIRANSLSLGYSAVNPEVLHCLIDLINHDIIPEVPKRGSVSASGDLMPISYIAALLEGRKDLRVCYRGNHMRAPEAFSKARLTPVTLTGKDGLAILNSSSFAASLGADLFYRYLAPVIILHLFTCFFIYNIYMQLLLKLLATEFAT